MAANSITWIVALHSGAGVAFGMTSSRARMRRSTAQAAMRLERLPHVRRALRAGRRPRDRLLHADAANHLRRPVVRHVLRAGRERPRDLRPAARLDPHQPRGNQFDAQNLRLPSWQWGRKPDGSFGVLDPEFRFRLRSVDRLRPAASRTSVERDTSYTQLGEALAAQIVSKEVTSLPGLGPMLLPGPQGFKAGGVTRVNPSYCRCPCCAHSPKPSRVARGANSPTTLQARQNHRAAGLRARLGGVASGASSWSIQRMATPAATTRSACICGPA
jgi:hypothetical protein